jgi:hypothetical protein
LGWTIKIDFMKGLNELCWEKSTFN